MGMKFSPMLLAHLLCLALVTVQGAPNARRDSCPDFPLPVHEIHRFPKDTWIENLAIRHNGQILATDLYAPMLYQVDPVRGNDPILVATIPYTLSLSGIAELGHDIFYVIAGNFSVKTLSVTPYSYSVWKVDMKCFYRHAHSKLSKPANISKVADLPDAQLLNGMTVADAASGILLISDSAKGSVWSLHVNTGVVRNAIQDPSMAIPSNSEVPLGINGVRVLGTTLYFTNLAAATFNKVTINADGSAAGPVAQLASRIPGDDFALDAEGDAYIALGVEDELLYLDAGGSVQAVVAGHINSTELAAPTSASFGRLPRDLERNSLYVSSSGAKSNFTGGISRVDLGFGCRFHRAV